MKLAMTLLLRDEEDIVAANVDFHLAQGVDLLVVTDNGSVDGTVGILEGYESRGLLRLIHEPRDDYSQARWVTRMARLAADEGADWVINADADEFWWSTGAPDLRAAFASLPDEVGVVRVPRHNFPPLAPDSRPFFERMTLRDLESRNSRGKPLRPKLAHRAHPGVEVGMGNHTVSAPGGLGGRSRRSGIEILHFPLRTYEQFENKIVKGGRALAANTELPQGKVQTWRELYERWQEGGLGDFYARETADPGASPSRYVEDTRLREFLRDLYADPRRNPGAG